jgi:hypothetical protein
LAAAISERNTMISRKQSARRATFRSTNGYVWKTVDAKEVSGQKAENYH